MIGTSCSHMNKDFDRWNGEKKALNRSLGSALFHEREIWWCALGVNIGYEQDGGNELFTRPVVILAKFNLDACLIVPLTARQKKGKYYFPLGMVEDREAVAVLSQMRFIDRKRLTNKIVTLDKETFKALSMASAKACLPGLYL